MDRTVLMQGRNTVTQELVTWIADSEDWEGEQSPVPVADVVLYTRGPVSTVETVPIVCSIDFPIDGTKASVGVAIEIAGALTRPGTVEIVGFGSATVAGLSWSYLLTPASAGSLLVSAVATDAVNGSTNSDSVTLNVVAFPSSVTPNVVAWLDGNQPQYSDAAGTVPATAFRAPVRRVNEASPLTGNWQAADDAHRPYRDNAGLRFDFDAPPSIVRSATAAVSLQDSTIALSLVQRGGNFRQGLIAAAASGGVAGYGVINNGSSIAVLSATGFSVPATPIPVLQGHRISIVLRYTATGLTVRVSDNGVVTDYSLAAVGVTMPAGSVTGPLKLAHNTLADWFYGSFAQALVCNRSITSTETNDLLTWLDAQPLTEAFPVDAPLLTTLGDSITQGMWSTPAATSLRATYVDLEVLNVAVFGSFTSDLAAQYSAAAPYYSALRARNVDVIGSGTNDLAGATAPATISATIFSQVDAALALGRRVAIASPIDRVVSVGDQARYNADRATLRGLLSAGVSSRASPNLRFIDGSAIPGMGANGDAANITLFSDGVHPRSAGYAVMAPYWNAEIAQLLA